MFHSNQILNIVFATDHKTAECCLHLVLISSPVQYERYTLTA
jgi:hypothetical protein